MSEILTGAGGRRTKENLLLWPNETPIFPVPSYRGLQGHHLYFILFLFYLNYLFILLWNIVLVLTYIDLNPPWVYMCYPSWNPLPNPSPSPPSGSSQCTSPEHPASWNTFKRHKQNLVHTRTQGKGSVTPQETEPAPPVSVSEAPVEVCVISGTASSSPERCLLA